MPNIGHRSFFLRCRRCRGEEPECVCCSGIRGLEEHRLYYISFGGESFGPFVSEKTALACKNEIEHILPGDEKEKNLLWAQGTRCKETMDKLLDILDRYTADDPVVQALVRVSATSPTA